MSNSDSVSNQDRASSPEQDEKPQNLVIKTMGFANKNEDLKEEEGEDLSNWFELRLNGRLPDRRGYHSTFIY